MARRLAPGQAALSPERAALAAANLKLAFWVARRAERARADVRALGPDDADGAALLGLCRAAMGFDPSRGVRFGTYAARVIWTELRRAATAGAPGWARPPDWVLSSGGSDRLRLLASRARRRLRVPRGGDPALLSRGWFSASARDDPDTLRPLLARLGRSHPRLLALVRLCYLEGRTLREVGLELGVSRQRTLQLREEALTLLRRYVAEGGL